jgi:polyribonucleotide nucleotidyltransferase
VVIACEVFSVDYDCSPEVTAMIGASAAVAISDVPFDGPIAGIVLGWDGEKYLFNPTQEERNTTNRMITTIAATHKKIVMIESEAKEVPDEIMYEGIVQAHEHVQPVLDLIDKMVAEIGKPKFEYEHASFDQELFDLLCANDMEGMEFCMDTDDKNVRESRVNDWITKVQEKYLEEHPDMMNYMEEILYKMQKKIVKKWLLEGHRVDGRKMNEIRPLERRGRRHPQSARLRAVHPRPDPGAVHRHPFHPLRQSEAGHHLGRGREALHAPLQHAAVLHRRSQSRPFHRPPRIRPRRSC